MKVCKTSDIEEIIYFLCRSFLYRIPAKINSDREGAFILKAYCKLCKSRTIEIEYSTPRNCTGNGVVEKVIQLLKNGTTTNMKDGMGLTGSVRLRVMRFSILAGLRISLSELHHGRKPKTKPELSNFDYYGKNYLPNWSELSV